MDVFGMMLVALTRNRNAIIKKKHSSQRFQSINSKNTSIATNIESNNVLKNIIVNSSCTLVN